MRQGGYIAEKQSQGIQRRKNYIDVDFHARKQLMNVYFTSDFE